MLSEQMALMRSCYVRRCGFGADDILGKGECTHGVLSLGRFALCTDGADESRY